MGQVGLAIDGCKRTVYGVRSVGDFDAAYTRNIVAWIEGEPFLAEINFAVGVKIHRRARVNIADVRQMSGDVTGGQIEGAA